MNQGTRLRKSSLTLLDLGVNRIAEERKGANSMDTKQIKMNVIVPFDIH